MAVININNIENVEGKYHLVFLEGKNIVDQAKNDLRFAFFSLLAFCAVVFLFVVVSGFNMYYVGFLVIFLVFFFAMLIYLLIVKHKGKKMCIYAVQNSRTSDIVAKQVDRRKASRAIVKSMSSTLDKYDEKNKYPGFYRKFKRSRKHAHLVGVINEFEKEELKKKKRS